MSPKKYASLWLLIALVVVFGMPRIPAVFAATDITDCGTIASSGEYVLTNNITAITGDCIVVTADNVTIDGADYTITGSADAGDIGINASSLGGSARGFTGLIVENITITGFDKAISTQGSAAGADYLHGGSITVSDATIVGEVNANAGGPANNIAGSAGAISITDSSVTGNVTAMAGRVTGRDSLQSGTVTIHGSTITGDIIVTGGSCENGSGGQGGIVVVEATSVVTGTIYASGGIGDNGSGGAGGSVTVTDSTVEEILALGEDKGSSGNGGAGGTVVLSSADTDDITASGGDGSLAGAGGPVTVTASTTGIIISNGGVSNGSAQAGGDGGAITVTATSVTGNITVNGGDAGSSSGGGAGGAVIVSDSTVGNIVSNAGAGSSAQGGNGGAITLTASVVGTINTSAGNTCCGGGTGGHGGLVTVNGVMTVTDITANGGDAASPGNGTQMIIGELVTLAGTLSCLGGNAGVGSTSCIAPVVSSLEPLDDAPDISTTANLVLTFSEAMRTMTGGTIVIYKTSDDSVLESITLPSTKVTGFNTDTVTINPAASFAATTEYYVQISTAAFRDSMRVEFAGITDTTSWSFTTGAAPSSSSSANTGGGGRGYWLYPQPISSSAPQLSLSASGTTLSGAVLENSSLPPLPQVSGTSALLPPVVVSGQEIPWSVWSSFSADTLCSYPERGISLQMQVSPDFYQDVHVSEPDHWFARDILWATARMIVHGDETPDGILLHRFRPQDAIRPAEALRILLDARGMSPVSDPATWEQDYTALAHTLGIRIINHRRTITRAEALSLLLQVYCVEPAPESTVVPFRDVPGSHRLISAIRTGVSFRIITGVRPTIFEPDTAITRAEFVAMLVRLLVSER